MTDTHAPEGADPSFVGSNRERVGAAEAALVGAGRMIGQQALRAEEWRGLAEVRATRIERLEELANALERRMDEYGAAREGYDAQIETLEADNRKLRNGVAALEAKVADEKAKAQRLRKRLRGRT